jgi:3-isopropylmalate/(R)-2-methylmalate dehydratase small subunit
VTGLIGAGIQAVFATSFARLQFRNAINYGLPFITSKDINLSCETGDILEYDSDSGSIRNLTNGKIFSSVPVATFVAEVAASGGLMNFIRQKMEEGTIHELH